MQQRQTTASQFATKSPAAAQTSGPYGGWCSSAVVTGPYGGWCSSVVATGPYGGW
jgi:hypothetical protein